MKSNNTDTASAAANANRQMILRLPKVWGAFDDADRVLEAARMQCAANATATATGMDLDQSLPPLLLLGSDVLYDPRQFEDVLATVSYILSRWTDMMKAAIMSMPTSCSSEKHGHERYSRFITVYHQRGSRRTIAPLLDRWQLQARVLSLHDGGDADSERETDDAESRLIDLIRSRCVDDSMQSATLPVDALQLLEIRLKDKD